MPLLRDGGWAAFDSVYGKGIGADTMSLQRLNQARYLFDYCYRTTTGAPLAATEHELPWSALLLLLPQAPGKDRAVAFHYGLDRGAFRLAWSYRTVDRTPDGSGLRAMHLTDHNAYEYVANALVQATEDQWTWAHQLRNDSNSYTSAVEVDRLRANDPTDHWDPVRPCDVLQYVLPWEQRLERLYADNRTRFAGNEQYLYLVASCTADWRAQEVDGAKGIVHTITLHLRLKVPGRPVVDLIADGPGDPQRPYAMRGVDLGNMCPANCILYSAQ